MCVKRILSRCKGTARCPKGVGKQGWSGLQPGAHGDAASSGPNVLFFKNIWILEFKKRKEKEIFFKNGLKKKKNYTLCRVNKTHRWPDGTHRVAGQSPEVRTIWNVGTQEEGGGRG